MSRFSFLFLFAFSSVFASYDTAKAELESFLDRYSGSEGHLPAIEKDWLMFDLVMGEKPDVCVEIGVETGVTIIPTAIALKELGHGIIYAIDPWDLKFCEEHWSLEDPNHDIWKGRDMEIVYNEFVSLIKSYNLDAVCSILRESSTTAASKIPSIDILHIDGNHSAEGMTFDTLTYGPKVRIGGHIWIDDVGWTDGKGNVCATEALKYLFAHCEKILEVKGGYLFRKIID